MMRCLAVDDEPFALALLEDNIRQVPFLELIATSASPMEAMNLLTRQEVDLIFLDIQMPGLTGLQFLQTLKSSPLAIFITAYDKYALQGFNLDVVDYLVKPVPFERFLKACNKAFEIYTLRHPAVSSSPPPFFFVPAEYGLVKLVTGEITWIEGVKDYVKVHFLSEKPLLIRMTMKAIEEKLSGAGFSRIHRSYIVSIAHIRSVKKTSVYVGESELPVSDLYRDDFMAAIGQR